MQNKALAISPAITAGLARAFILALATLAALCMFAVPWAGAQEPGTQNQIVLVIDDAQPNYGLGQYTYVLHDADKTFTPESIVERAERLTSSQRNVRRILDMGYTGDKKWLVMKVQNLSSTTEWVLDFGNTLEGRYGFIKSIDAWRYNAPRGADTLFEAPKPLAPQKLSKRLDKNLIITLPRGEESLVIFAVETVSGIPLTVDMKLSTKDFAIQKQSRLIDPMAFLMIFLCGMAFFFLSVGLSKQSWDHIPYAGYYVLLAVIFQWNNTSIFGPFPIKAEMLPLLMGMLTLCSIGLTKVFLGIRAIDFTERYVLNGLAILVLIGGAGALLPLDTAPLLKTFMFYGPCIITFLTLPVLCFAQAQAGKEEAYPLIWSWLFHVAGLVISGAALAGFLKLSGLTVNAFWLMLVPQSVFFAVSTLKKIEREQDMLFEEKAQENKETLSLVRLRHTKESAEQARLLKVIEKEREILAQMREREAKQTEEMRLAKIAADEANRAKSAFLAVVSHEIRTPMTGIMGMVRLMLDTSLNKDQKDYVLTVQDSGDSMLTLLNDILDFEKIERGKMELENISFDLPRLIQGVATLMSGHAAHKNIGLKTHIDPSLPAFVIGDPNRLRQVLLNLAGNAIKFTKEGNVVIRIEPDGEPANNIHAVKFSVQDSGIGISPEAQKNLFTPFSQADSSISRKFGGTGLGLAICKGLIEAMGSRIRVTSKEGEGSTFHFTVKMQAAQPAAQATEQVAPVRERIPGTGRHVLVVDDNDINRKVVIGLLARINCTSDSAPSAEQALNMIAENNYDLILMDIQLPNMKGDEAAMVIRQMADPVKAGVPIVALSGNVMQEDIERFQQAGMNDFIAKPIDPERLEHVVMNTRALFAKPTAAPPRRPAAIEGVAAPKPNNAVFDQSTLRTLKDTLGKDQLQELLDGLLEKTTEIVEALQQASAAQDVPAIAARAHELKGMAGNFGLVEISRIAGETEKKARANDTGDLSALLSGLPDAKTRAESALASWIAS